MKRFPQDIPLVSSAGAIHAGDDCGCSSRPIYQGTNNRGSYTRDNNPTIDSFEARFKQLEGAESAIGIASGMAAISQTLLTFLRQGARLVHHYCLYSGAIGLINETLLRFGIECVAIDMTKPEVLKEALTRKTDVVYFEVHSNPRIEVVDVRQAVELAHAAGALVIIDNTFLTPWLIRPLELGADIVIHSATKYLMGHGNGLAGIACGSKKLMEQVWVTRRYAGGIMAPLSAFLLHQGLSTLPLRIERHCANAMQVAQFLADHPRVRRVHYPGLPSDPGHAKAKAQLHGGFGGMLGFEMDEEHDLKKRVRMCRPWYSLGDVQTLIMNYGQHYWRMSVGIEEPDAIIEDLKQALA